MTDIEKRAIAELRSVRMPDEGWHKKRAEYLVRTLASNPGWQLYPSETGDLWFLVWTYRRQIEDANVVAKANAIVNGALSLEFT